MVTTNMYPSQRLALERVTDTQWIGVKFLERRLAGRCGTHPGAIRFCEAVCQAHSGCIELLPEMICCEGARHAFGWTQGGEEVLSRKLAQKNGIRFEKARDLVKQVPVLSPSRPGICVGEPRHPDVWVTYARPEAVMRFVRLWETATGTRLTVAISSIMAVCGNAVVKAHVTQSISLSFGCPDSRQYGGIRPEELVVAVPARVLDDLDEAISRDSLALPR